jgi:hypothetical protein
VALVLRVHCLGLLLLMPLEVEGRQIQQIQQELLILVMAVVRQLLVMVQHLTAALAL